MTTNNSINNTLTAPYNIGGTSVATTGTQLNYLHGLTIGANANIITSNGSSMVSSSPSGIGCVQLISTQTAANSATIDFTGLSSTYFYYYVVYSNAQPVTNTANLTFRVSTDNGSTYSTTGYYYAQTLQNSSSGTGTVTATNTSGFVLSLSQATSGNNNAGGVIDIINPSQSSSYHQFLNKTVYIDSAGVIDSIIGGCMWISTTAINAIRFLYSSGNINTGTFKLYGVLA